MKKQFFFAISLVLFVVSIASAQTPPAPVKQIFAGVVNGKAVTLARPAYPPAARAVNAEGSVNVQIVIDEEGNVVSASAISGHPLLRQAAEQAALQSKFKPTQLSGQPVKVSGVLVYNFVAADRTANWFKVGYDLANIENSSTLLFINTDAIAKKIPADWTAEKEQMQKLTEMKQSLALTAPPLPPVATGKRIITEDAMKKEDGTTVKRMIVQRVVNPGNPLTGEQFAIVQSLNASLQGRLAGDELNLWQFNLGARLSEAWAKVGVPTERQRVLDSLRQQIQSAPSAVPADYLAAVQQIIALLEKPNLTTEDRREILQIMPKLSGN